MKSSSKADNILNEYIINNTDLSSTNEHLFTQQSVKNNLNMNIHNRRNLIKNNPFQKDHHFNTSYKKSTFQYNNLIKAIESNNIKKVGEYLDGNIPSINILNKNGISPLHTAVINGNLEIINLLLEKGANPNLTSIKKKQTPLHYAYIFKNLQSNKIINLLLKYNANPNLEDINNKRPKEYSLKYKESSDIDNYTSSNDNENENLDVKLDTKIKKKDENMFQDYYIENNNKNTYSISDSEDTIIQQETKRNNLYSIDELINNHKKYNKEKLRIISKRNRNNEYYQKIKKEMKASLSNKNIFNSKESDTFIDSLEINKKNYCNNTFNKNLNHVKLKTKKSKNINTPNNLKLNKELLLKVSPAQNEKYKSEDNAKKEININKQYFINNEFFNNYYNGQEYFKSKIAKKLFKIPNSNDKNRTTGALSSSMASTDIQTSKKGYENNIINNNVAEFVYTDENTETKNFEKLRNWLETVQLPSYFNNFVNNNMTDINKLINEYRTNREKINYQYIENRLNIHIPGHIYRILCRLEVDGSFIENKISMFLLGINCFNEDTSSKKNLSKIFIQSDECSDRCFNCCDTKKSLIEKKDLKAFLRKYKIMHLYNNFYHNGFELINFVILQMFTKFAINDEIIQKCFHIYNKRNRYLVLDALFNEVKEINIFFSTNIYNNCLFPKYENNDWGINWDEESINEENKPSNDCVIY